MFNLFNLSDRLNRRRIPTDRVRWLAAATLLIPALALACGPWFPNRILVGGDAVVTDAPVGDFAYLLDRIAPAPDVPETARPPLNQTVFDHTATLGERDLAAALAERNVPVVDADRIRARYTLIRDQITIAAQQQADAREKGIAPEPFDVTGLIPDGMPGEFTDYLTGAAHYHLGDRLAARRAWLALLNRPADERRYRSVWAAYMIGRTYVEADADRAAAYFQLCRKLAAEGFHDSTGLASASYGWEARAALDAGQVRRAFDLYLAQRETGDPTATESLRMVAGKVFDRADIVLEACARSAAARRVITAYVLALDEGFDGKASEQTRRWTSAVEAAEVDTVEGAGLLAWMAYRSADYDRARVWAAKAGDASAIALWVRAKLLMRDGKIDDAIDTLAAAARRFPADEVWPDAHWYPRVNHATHGAIVPRDEVLGEQAALTLTRGRFAEALGLLLDSGEYWADAAYVADQVLTLDELKAFVDARPAPGGDAHDDGWAPETRADQHEALRHLLARRLTRHGRWKEARGYFSAERLAQLDAYIAAIRAGHDRTRSRAERAESFWTAATIAREHGMDLLGTELDPDHAIHGGNFGDAVDKPYRTDLTGPAMKATRDELERVNAHRPTPNKRWHYRYTACDHAWSACELMDDGTDLLASRLQEAGMWIAAKDPESADRFYKALVARCGNAELGRQADAKRWFPAMKKQH